MSGAMRFEYLSDCDAVHASFVICVLETKEDVDRWEREVGQKLSAFGRKVDLIIDMNGLQVRAKAGSAFGAARARVLTKYSKHSVRYGGDRATRTSVLTSAVIHAVEANFHETKEEAIKALRALREAERR